MKIITAFYIVTGITIAIDRYWVDLYGLDTIMLFVSLWVGGFYAGYYYRKSKEVE